MTDLDSLLASLNGPGDAPPIIDDIPPPPEMPLGPPGSLDEAPDIPPPPPPVGGDIDLDDLLEADVNTQVAAEVSLAEKETEMLVSAEAPEDVVEITEEDKEFETPEQRTLRVIRLRNLNPALPKYKLKVRFLDDSEGEYEVTSDWSVGNLIALISDSIGIGEGAGLFHISEGKRSSNVPISSENYERWFPRDVTLEEVGLTPARSAQPTAPPLYFRMRWFAIPSPALTDNNPALQHQVYLHVLRSMTYENIPLDQKLAIRQTSLMLQAKFGDYDPEKTRTNTIVSAHQGTYFNRSVAEEAGDLVRFEQTIFEAYKKLRGMKKEAAEHEFIYSATSTWSPLSCGTVFNISGRTGVPRRTIILPDGVAVEVGSTIRFHPLEKIAGIDLTEDLQTITITVICPPNGATRDVLPRETMQFTTAEAQAMYDLLCGYVAIIRPRFPKSAPDTRDLIQLPYDAPPLCLYAPTPLRQNILLSPSIAHAFYNKFESMCKTEKVEVPKQLFTLMTRFMDEFPMRGFNETEFCAIHGLESAATMTKIVIPGAPPPSESEIPPILPFPVLDRLDVSSWQLKPKHMHILMASLAFVAEFMDQTGIAQNFVVRKLDLSCNPQPNSAVFFNDLRLMTTSKMPLTTLYLRKMKFTSEDAGNITSTLLQCKTLEAVCFGDNEKLGGEACSIILNGLITDMPVLNDVSFINCGVGAAFIEKAQAVIHRHKRPKKLTISQNKMDKNGIKAIVKLLSSCEAFDELEIRDCNIGSNAMKIFEVLPDSTTIKRLNISKNDIGEKCFLKLASLIGEGRCYLQKLDISENDLGKKGYLEMFAALSSTRAYVTSLVMGNIKFPKQAAEKLADLANSHLVSLDLKASEMPRECIKSLMTIISTSKTLKSLCLSANDFKGDAAAFEGLGKAVQASSLEEFTVNSCAIKTDCLGLMFKAMAGAKKLKKLCLCGNKVSKETLVALAGVANAPGSLLNTIEMRSLVTGQDCLTGFFEALSKRPIHLQNIDMRFIKGIDGPSIEAAVIPFSDKIHILM